MSYLPIDLMTSEIRAKRRLKTSTLDSFSAAGESGKAYATTVPVTLAAGAQYSVKLQKNSNVAVRFIRAEGLYVEAVSGQPAGNLVSLNSFISTNGIVLSDFIGSIEVYDGEPTGDVVLGALNELKESFYPDGELVIELRNDTLTSISTFLSIGVEQVSASGVYTILEPATLLEPTTEMSRFNGLN